MWTNLFVNGILLDAGIRTMRFVSNTSGIGINRMIFQKSSSTGTELETADEDLRLDAAFPNPSRSAVTIGYRLPDATRATLDFYDMLGRRVYSMDRGIQGPGQYTVNVETGDLPGGVYLYRLSTDFGKVSRLLTVHP